MAADIAMEIKRPRQLQAPELHLAKQRLDFGKPRGTHLTSRA
jgi:hypothetical protein